MKAKPLKQNILLVARIKLLETELARAKSALRAAAPLVESDMRVRIHIKREGGEEFVDGIAVAETNSFYKVTWAADKDRFNSEGEYFAKESNRCTCNPIEITI